MEESTKVFGVNIKGINFDFVKNFIEQNQELEQILKKRQTNDNKPLNQVQQIYEKLAETANSKVDKKDNVFYVKSIQINDLSPTKKAFFKSFQVAKQNLSDQEFQLNEEKKSQEKQNLILLNQQQTINKQEDNGNLIKISTPHINFKEPTKFQIAFPGVNSGHEIQKHKNLQGDNAHNSEIKKRKNHHSNNYTSKNNIPVQKFIIPIQNNTEIYCICQQPGESDLMILCNNEDCKNKWFHTACVGLEKKTQEEIGKLDWYCQECEKNLNEQIPKQNIKE